MPWYRNVRVSPPGARHVTPNLPSEARSLDTFGLNPESSLHIPPLRVGIPAQGYFLMGREELTTDHAMSGWLPLLSVVRPENRSKFCPDMVPAFATACDH